MAALLTSPPTTATEPSPDIPAWLVRHIGDDNGQIASVVLQRARGLYRQKVSEGAVKNSCYFAMDATRPNTLNDGILGLRFYVICEGSRSFRAISAGHGSGRDLGGVADFSNGRQCAKNFSNARDSNLTTGGAYVTAETKETYKGYYRTTAHQEAVLLRPFVQFDGDGDTANARQRAIGGHAAVTLSDVCLRKKPNSSFANSEGYVPLGTLADYSGGRSDGCTSWSPSDTVEIVALVKNNPATLYLYPEAADINAAAHGGAYWNAFCLSAIHAPKFWPKETLEPLIEAYKRTHPPLPPRPLPYCKDP